MKKTNNVLNLLRNFLGKVYKIIEIIKLNMKLSVIFLINTMMRRKLTPFYVSKANRSPSEHKSTYETKIFTKNKLKKNLKQTT